MKTLFASVLPLIFFVSLATAQGGPAGLLPVEKDEAGAIKRLDYGVPLSGISDPGMLLSHFSQRMLLVYYYSPKCPHCIASYPKYQAIVNEYAPQGLAGIAISVGQIKRNDIRAFMDNQNVTVPMFQDANRKFSDLYGLGHVPMMMLVMDDGSYVRLHDHNEQTLTALKAVLTQKLRP